MPRYAEGRAEKGSQLWLQRLINNHTYLINDEVCKVVPGIKSDSIKWLSPVKDDDFSEYRDKAFIDRLNLTLNNVPLKDFWPRGGPVWDGLGRADDQIFLIEAKAHIPELDTSPMKASPDSAEKIANSLRQVKAYVNSRSPNDWTRSFYQYTNRLAHLYLLRTLNNVDAWLFNIYFVGDEIMKGPQSGDEWKGAIRLVRSHLGLGKYALKEFQISLFFHVKDLVDFKSPPNK